MDHRSRIQPSQANHAPPPNLGLRLTGSNRANQPPDDYFTPFFESRVPLVIPWRALNFGFALQITYRVPLRRTTWLDA